MFTCTETKQSWGVAAKARSDILYAPKPMKEMCCIKKRFPVFVPPTTDEDEIFEKNVLECKWFYS